MKLLITGGLGFIGSNFIHYLFRQYKNEVKIINLDKITYSANPSNLKEFEKNKNYTFIKGSITDSDLVDNLLNKENPDAIFHFAAESHVDKSIEGPAIFIESNIKGTFVLLEAIRKQWSSGNNKRFVHVSTDEVFGSLGDKGFFTQETPYSPNSPYSATKASSDMLVRAYCKTYGINAIITNCSNNYGPFQFPEKLIPLLIINALTDKPLPIYGDGLNVRDWIFVEDHAKGLFTAFEKGKTGNSYLFGGGNEITNLALAHRLCELLDIHLKGKKKETRRSLIKYVPDRPGHDRRYAIDFSQTTKEIGWKPQADFKEGLEKTVNWYVENQEWWIDILKRNDKLYYYGL